jgi:hypothetical protein
VSEVVEAKRLPLQTPRKELNMDKIDVEIV